MKSVRLLSYKVIWKINVLPYNDKVYILIYNSDLIICNQINNDFTHLRVRAARIEKSGGRYYSRLTWFERVNSEYVRNDGPPQIGFPIRVVVVDLDVLSEDYPEYKNFRKAYINPHILEVSGEEISMEEGCLSLPGIHESVKRGNRIHVTYMDEDMVEHDEVVEGYLARVMQHEFDHLEGKMFIDHLSPLRKQMIKGKLNAMLKGKAHCTYKVKTVK